MEDWWRLKAKCLGMDPNLFVPTGPGGSLKRVYAICNGGPGDSPCPVKTECDQFAIKHGLVGVFGGRLHQLPRSPKVEVLVEVQNAQATESRLRSEVPPE